MNRINNQIAVITGSDLPGITQAPSGPATGCVASTTQDCVYPLVDYGWNVISILFVLAVWGFFISTLIGGVFYLFSMGNEEGIAKSKKTFINSLIGLALVFGSYNILNLVIGQVGPSLQQGSLDIGNIVGRTYAVITTLSGAGFLILLLFGGVQYLLAAGNEEGVQKAKKTITTSIVGIVIVAFAYAIARIVLSILGIHS